MLLSNRSVFKLFAAALLNSVLFVFLAPLVYAQTTYSGITFQDGDQSFADAVIDYTPGVFPSSSPQCNTPTNALGPPDRSSVSCGGYVSLGQGGSLTLSLTNPALMASGTSQPDLHIFEIGSAVELFKVEVSVDGIDWITIGELSGQPSSVDIDAHPDIQAGDSFGFIRLTDLSNTNNGADIDAVGVNPQYLPPTSDAGPDQSVVSAQSVTLDGSGSASSVSGVLITYAWSQASGPSVVLSDSTSAMPVFTAPTVALGGLPRTLVFELVVTDDLGQVSETDVVSITVNAPEDTPPTADAGTNQSVASGSIVTLDGSNSGDPDLGDSITYQWAQVSGPEMTLNDSTSAKPSFSAPTLLVNADAVTLVFELVVTDSLNASSTPDRVTITVNPPGDTPPTADAGTNQSVASGSTVTLDGSDSSDPDLGDTITYQWRQISGIQVSLNDVTSAKPSFTAPALLVTDAPLTLVFELVVTDSLNASSTPDRVTITVNPPGDTPPTADAGINLSVASGSTVTLDGSDSSDPDSGDTITYQWRQIFGMEVALSDVASAKPSFDAPTLLVSDDPEILVFELVVTDSLNASSTPDRVTITVNPPGDTPPTADAGTNQSVASGSTVTLDGSNSSDPDLGDTITYLWRQISGTQVSLNDVTSAKPSFTAPTLLVTDAHLTLVFELVVADSLNESSTPDRVTITVNPPGDTPPTADAGTNQSVASGSIVTLDGSNSSDPDLGDSITYQWAQVSGLEMTLNDLTSAKPIFSAPTLLVTDTAVTLVFELVVTDALDRSSTPDRVTITVNPPGDAPPTADAGTNQSVASGSIVTLDGSNSSDPDLGDTITYLWRQISGVEVALSDATSPKPSFDAPNLLVTDQPKILVFELVVTDAVDEPSELDQVTITVNPPGDTPPTADAGTNQSVASGSIVTLDGSSSSDPDRADTITYQWRQISGIEVAFSDVTSVKPSFDAPTLLVTDDPEILVFELVVIDALNESSTPDRVTITVNPPGDTPPTADAGIDQSVASGSAVTLDGSNSSDSDLGDTITYLWRQISGVEVSLSDQTSVNPTFDVPAISVVDDPIILVFELVVTDSLNASSTPDRVTITVNPPGDAPPTADAGTNQSVASGSAVTLDGSNSNDPDPGDIISYRWRQISGAAVNLSDVTAARPSFEAPTLLVRDDPVTLVFELVVTDSLNASSTPDRVTVSVNPPGDTPPTASITGQGMVATEANVVLDGSGSSDPDPSDEIRYQWRQISGPSVVLSDAGASRPEFVAPKLNFGDPAIRLVFELVVVDLSGRLSEPERFVVVVEPPDQPPPMPVPTTPIWGLWLLILGIWGLGLGSQRL